MKLSQVLSAGALACAAITLAPATVSAETCVACTADAMKVFTAVEVDADASDEAKQDAACDAFDDLNSAIETCADCTFSDEVTDIEGAALKLIVVASAMACDVKLPAANNFVKEYCKDNCFEAIIKPIDASKIVCDDITAGQVTTYEACLHVCPQETLHDADGKGADQLVDALKVLADDDTCKNITPEEFEKFEASYNAGAGYTTASAGLVASAALMAAVAPNM